MIEFRTTCFSGRDEPEISYAVAPELGTITGWLLDYFETEGANGRRFREGDNVQVGWSVLMLKRSNIGDLELWEPRFDAIPLQWTLGATTAFRHLVLQRAVCSELGCEPDFPSLRQAGIASPGLLTTSAPLQMSRDPPRDNDSGWVFADPRSATADGELRSLFEMAVRLPQVVPFIALPPGASVTLSNSITIRLGDRQISSNDNDLLRRILDGADTGMENPGVSGRNRER